MGKAASCDGIIKNGYIEFYIQSFFYKEPKNCSSDCTAYVLGYLEWVANVTEEDYYIRMMIAWFFATALAKKYDESVIYLEEHRLDSWTHKKAIQKTIESYRVSDEHKEYPKFLRH